jgi:protease PrsW
VDGVAAASTRRHERRAQGAVTCRPLGPDDASTSWPLLLAGAFGGGWLAYFRWKDKRHPEPLHIVVLAVSGGMLAVAGALLGFQLLESQRASPQWQTVALGSWPAAALAALKIGLIEELAKLAPVVFIARFTRRFDELLDGIVYAGASAIGFATVETLFLAANGLGGLELAARAVTSPITHALFAAPAGLGLACWALQRRPWPLAFGFLASVALHGGFDLLVARAAPLSALVALAAWVWLLYAVLKAEKVAPFAR